MMAADKPVAKARHRYRCCGVHLGRVVQHMGHGVVLLKARGCSLEFHLLYAMSAAEFWAFCEISVYREPLGVFDYS
ncbi:MAG: hypothetical protein WD294_04620 [Phycisphaeraceae bacterium]